jgi:bifunctional non-homologous end joining protein LigD
VKASVEPRIAAREKQMKSTILYYSDMATGGSSDKEYRIQLESTEGGCLVNFQYGRRGGTLQAGTKTPSAVGYKQAEEIYDRLVREKMSKGYVGAEAGSTSKAPTAINKSDTSRRTPYPQEKLEEIDVEEAERLVKDPRYVLELKANGHFRQAEKLTDGSIISFNKKGEPKPFPPEVVEELAALPLKTFFFDGELVGSYYSIFQMLQKNGECLKALPYEDRHYAAREVIQPHEKQYVKIIAQWEGTREKQHSLALYKKNRVEGVAFKRKDAPYRAGDSGVHKKFKFVKTCTCRILALGTKGHDNASLGLLKGDEWVNVGGASMIGKDKRIKVGSLVEVRFLYFTGSRLYQPRIERLRLDQTEKDCDFNQLRHAYQEGVEAA